MNVLVIGSGGREHAIVKALSKSKTCSSVCAIPGNPGIATLAKCIDIDPMNNELIKEFCAKQKIDLIIPGSEVYLENGIHDVFIGSNVNVFGPTKNAAQIESSKEYAKDLMKKYNIPTAAYEVYGDYDKAKEYIDRIGVPIVLKYDGLAGGKGVVVCMTLEEAYDALDIMLNKKVYGRSNVVIEEYLEGPEFSLMSFVHHDKIITMPIAQDHKRLLDGDLGPNTGGMGIYSSVPIISKEVIEEATVNVMEKTINAMIQEGNPFTGFLYGGLMLTKNGPKVIEFNARFGDPEAEVILPKLESDIVEIIMNLLDGTVVTPVWSDSYYVGVVLASKGYPTSYDKGYDIEGVNDISDFVYHMGTKLEDGKLKTNGGRVLLVLGKGESLEEAQKHAYENVSTIKCENLVYRNDIGHKALKG